MIHVALLLLEQQRSHVDHGGVAPTKLKADSVLAWRLGRQMLDPRGKAGAVTTLRRLCGVQAQVASAAQLAVAARQLKPKPGALAKALTDRSIVKTWAMRGTLHLMHAADAPAYLSLIAAARTWDKGSWQRTFVTAAQLDAITAAVREVLNGKVLSREQLVAAIVDRTGNKSLAEHLQSGWGAVLKPLSWQGYLCQGPAEGSRITFTSPETWLPAWPGLPAPEQAAQVVIPSYLGAYGPATAQTFDAWLTRGASKKAALRGWFADLSDEVVEVEVEGTRAYARAADVDDIASTAPSKVVRLLPGFDQYVLGPGTTDTSIIAKDRRSQISKAAGWISPVVVAGGRVAGTWEIKDDAVEVVLFGEAGKVSAGELEAETARLSSFRGTALRLSVS